MSIPRTSQAVILTARLNPINPEEASALRIIQEQREKGYNFKNVIVDAINRCGGMTPEMFTHDEDRQLTRLSEEVLSQFTEQVLNELRSNGVSLPQSATERDDEDKPLSKFSKNFAKGVKQRQEQTYEDIDE
jgi:hypothetical protein